MHRVDSAAGLAAVVITAKSTDAVDAEARLLAFHVCRHFAIDTQPRSAAGVRLRFGSKYAVHYDHRKEEQQRHRSQHDDPTLAFGRRPCGRT